MNAGSVCMVWCYLGKCATCTTTVSNGWPCSQLSTTSTSNLACPLATALAEELGKLPSEAALVIYSIAELADAASASRMHIFLDERTHPKQSLLHHGFAAFQGPALCFHIPGKKHPRPFQL